MNTGISFLADDFCKLASGIRRLYRRYIVLTANQREWLKDLRSGQYKQTRGTLQNGDAFCCLGVACLTYERVTGGFAQRDSREITGGSLMSQKTVQHWIGLKDCSGAIGESESLTHLNDEKHFSFSQIADFIEDNAEKLFVKK